MKYPNPVYEHRVISGLSVEQLAKLEACLASKAVMFTSSHEGDLVMPSDPKDDYGFNLPPPALAHVPCLEIWLEKDTATGGAEVPLATFAQSPKRDKKTGLWTVDIRIVVAIAYARDLADNEKGWQRPREVGTYRVSRTVRDAIDAALDLYPVDPDGEFVKMGEQHAIKAPMSPPPVPSSPVSSPWAQTRLSRPDRRKNLREQLRSNADQPPGLRTELSP